MFNSYFSVIILVGDGISTKYKATKINIIIKIKNEEK